MASQPSGQSAIQPQQVPPAVVPAPQEEPQSSSQLRGAPPSPLQTREPNFPAPANPTTTVSFPPNLSAATIDSAEYAGRQESYIPQPPQNGQSQARLSRHSVLRPHRGESYVGRPRTTETVPGLVLEGYMERQATLTVRDRMSDTIRYATTKKQLAKRKVNITRLCLYFIAGIQVLLGGLTTGLSAIRLDGKLLGIGTTVLGILSTLAGAFLGQIRATKEPESSVLRVQKLSKLIRECEAFTLDFGDDTTHDHDAKITHYRTELEHILAETTPPPPPPTTTPPDNKLQPSANATSAPFQQRP